MATHDHRRLVLLFLAAIILPSSVVVALGVRLIGQERELAEKRLADERARAAREVRQELLSRLERVKRQEMSAWSAETSGNTYAHNAVRLVAPVRHDRLVLPWERVAEQAHAALSEVGFADLLREGEREEFARNDPGKATALYRQAMTGSQLSVQAVYARLALARALAKSGRPREARRHYIAILSAPSNVTDEHGVPLSLYAATRLVQVGGGYHQVLERLDWVAEKLCCLAPPAMYLLRDLATALRRSATADSASLARARDLQRIVGVQLHSVEHALALGADFASLRTRWRTAGEVGAQDPVWIVHGPEPWLVNTALQGRSRPELLIAVDAAGIFDSLDAIGEGADGPAGQVVLLPAAVSQGEPLGPGFPGLNVVFSRSETRSSQLGGSLQRLFYLATLLAVLTVALFGAYLLWRDVRRELRMAETRSQFVAGVSHELKTPLTAIRMFAETLQMDSAAEPRRRAEYLDTIVNECERLTRLLNNVLDLVKIDQDQKRYTLKSTSLADVVQRSARAMEYSLGQQGLALHVEVEDGLPPVTADADALEQAILNLLNNAMKYSGESREIGLALLRRDGYAVIQVTDRGVGIPSSELARVTEKFYRVPTPQNRNTPGAGLGLTIVDHIAKAHGGHLQIESASGAGSAFSIHLPLEGES